MTTVLIVGLGHAGQRHARIAEHLGHEVLAYDTYAGVKTPGNVIFMNTLELALDRKPDAAIIATPPQMHLRDGLACLTAGIKHVMIEKPLALSVDAALTLRQVAWQCGATLSCGYMLRAHARYRECHQAILANRFGSIHTAHFECCWQPQTVTYDWPGVVAESSHELDAALWLFGSCKDGVQGQQDPQMRMARLSGQFGQVLCTFHVNTQTTIYARAVHVYGDRGDQRYDAEQAPTSWEHAYRRQLEAFLKGEPLCPAEAALETVRLIAPWGTL